MSAEPDFSSPPSSEGLSSSPPSKRSVVSVVSVVSSGVSFSVVSSSRFKIVSIIVLFFTFLRRKCSFLSD